MVKSETGKIIIMLGIILCVIGAIITIYGFNALLSIDGPSGYPFLFTMGIYVISGGASVVTLGIIIYYVGDKDILCSKCGNILSEDIYVCPSCNSKTPSYYHQKVHCDRCFRKTRYDKYGGRCKYCGNELKLLF